jgi:hypothetical protein
VATGRKSLTDEKGSNRSIRSRWQPTATVSERMVRRGSTVRVRQRSLQKSCPAGLFLSDELAQAPACGGYGAVYGAFRSKTPLSPATVRPPSAECSEGGAAILHCGSATSYGPNGLSVRSSVSFSAGAIALTRLGAATCRKVVRPPRDRGRFGIRSRKHTASASCVRGTQYTPLAGAAFASVASSKARER